MKARSMSLIWGLVLVLAGLLLLAQNQGWLNTVAPPVWIAFFVALSLLFFASYFINGTDQWGWLFPALIAAALALLILLDTAGVDNDPVAALLFVAIAIPFVVAYLQDRSRWWALIPAWVMTVLVVIILISDRVADELVGMVVLWGIGLPFLVVFLQDRTKWWALIPAGVLGAVGLIPPLTLGLSEEVMGPAVMFVLALAFFMVYIFSRKNWWALIPAGIFASIGVTVLLMGAAPADMPGNSRAIGVMLLGFALTFLAVWLSRRSAPADWAIYPAAALGVMGVVALLLGAEVLRYEWPIAIIAAGVAVLWGSVRQRARLRG